MPDGLLDGDGFDGGLMLWLSGCARLRQTALRPGRHAPRNDRLLPAVTPRGGCRYTYTFRVKTYIYFSHTFRYIISTRLARDPFRPRCRNGQDTRGVYLYAVDPSSQAATKLQAGRDPSHAVRPSLKRTVRCAGVWGVYVQRARTQSAHDLVLDKITKGPPAPGAPKDPRLLSGGGATPGTEKDVPRTG